MGRFKTQRREKISELVERASFGNLSSFAGVFQINPISKTEEASLEVLLEKYKTSRANPPEDLQQLKAITSEVKAIHNQAVILHGQRIKRAQELLKRYRDGAFSSWLLSTYGNRQTPYNFLKYYELYTSLPHHTQAIVDEMPRQAIYSLSSRPVSREKKVEFIHSYKGENKNQLLQRLREFFPLAKDDKRDADRVKTVVLLLNNVLKMVRHRRFSPTSREAEQIYRFLNDIQSCLNE